jgi:hypothetical protein
MTSTNATAQNITATFPGTGSATLGFVALMSPPESVEITALESPTDIPSLKLSAPEGTNRIIISSVSTVDKLEYASAGKLFNIAGSGASFTGPVTVTIPYDQILLDEKSSASPQSNVKLLHYTGTAWEDVTTSVNPSTHTVTGQITSLSPVIAAIVSSPTSTSTPSSTVTQALAVCSVACME